MILNWTRTGPCNQESARDLVSEIKTPNIDYPLKQVLRSKTEFWIKMWRWRTNDHSTKCPVFIRSPSLVNKVKACDYLVRLWLWLRARRAVTQQVDIKRLKAEVPAAAGGCGWLVGWFTSGLRQPPAGRQHFLEVWVYNAGPGQASLTDVLVCVGRLY